MEETHSSCLHLRSRSFDLYLQLLAIGEGHNVDYGKLRALPSGSASSLQHLSRAAPILQTLHQTSRPSPLHFPITCEQEPEILGLLCLGQELSPDNFPAEVRGADPHPDCLSLQTLPVPARGHRQKKPIKPLYLQRALKQIEVPRVRNFPAHGCASRFSP